MLIKFQMFRPEISFLELNIYYLNFLLISTCLMNYNIFICYFTILIIFHFHSIVLYDYFLIQNYFFNCLISNDFYTSPKFMFYICFYLIVNVFDLNFYQQFLTQSFPNFILVIIVFHLSSIINILFTFQYYLDILNLYFILWNLTMICQN